MPDSAHQEKPAATSKGDFPFSGAPALSGRSETVLNPEGRHSPEKPSSGSTFIRPDAQIQNILFPDYSQLEAGQLPASPAGVQLAHFEITDRIGSGGMGSVFLAMDLHLQRYVALKILSPSQAREHNSVQRFLNEARSAARLDFDGIARVHYYGEDKGFHFIAFEYITGVNVRDLIYSRGPLSPTDAINYVLQVAHALKHTSAAGVVHRDIKPSNIIINPAGRAKLVDLGLARKESTESMDDLTVAGTTLGTFDYISPEQAQDPRNVDVRSDIYSLGCTLYHMLTGEPPYPSGTLAQKLLEHQQGHAPSPSRKNRKVPPDLAAINQKMMSSDPRKRYQSPEALIRDLLAVAGNQGLRGVTTEGLVWAGSETRGKRELLLRNIGSILAVAFLLFIVFAIDRAQQEQTDSVTDRFPNQVASEPENPTINDSDQIRKIIENLPVPTATPDESIAAELPAESSTANANSGSIGTAPLMPPEEIFPAPSDQSNFLELLANLSPETNDVQTPFRIPDEYDPLVKEGLFNATVPTKPAPETKLETSPTPPPIAVRSVREKPIWLKSSESEEPKAFRTLEAACAEARDGSTIELRFNGPREGLIEKPIAISNQITIRAANGYRPRIDFASRENPDENDTRMFLLRGGSLDLANLDLVFTINDPLRSSSRAVWSMFSLQGADQLRLNNVAVTIDNKSHHPAALVEIARESGNRLDRMKMKMKPGSPGNPSDPFEVRISDCVLRGEMDGFIQDSIRPGSITLERSVVAASSSLFKNIGTSEMPTDSLAILLNLEHVTCVTGDSPYRIETGQLPREVIPVLVKSRNSIYALHPEHLAPFAILSGETNSLDLSLMLRWNGTRNYYHGFDLFRNVVNDSGFSPLENLTFDGWRSYWADQSSTSEVNPVAAEMTWASEWDLQWFSHVREEHVRIDDGVALDPEVIATDGTQVGAPVESLSFPSR